MKSVSRAWIGGGEGCIGDCLGRAASRHVQSRFPAVPCPGMAAREPRGGRERQSNERVSNAWIAFLGEVSDCSPLAKVR